MVTKGTTTRPVEAAAAGKMDGWMEKGGATRRRDVKPGM
jgi:hypothetical protein